MKDKFHLKFKCMHNSLLVLICLLWLPKFNLLNGETFSNFCIWEWL